MRRYIHQRLMEYYAQPASTVVGSLLLPVEQPHPPNINFRTLWGAWHWQRVYGRLYRETAGQWLTPSELFAPHYSYCLANFILQQQQQQTANESLALEIVELGGGRGTNAVHILNHLQQTNPPLYDRCSYTILDASPTLLPLQRERLDQTVHADKVRCEYRDMLHVAEGHQRLWAPAEGGGSAPAKMTLVLALEVLDNLPHDKIRIGPTIRDGHVAPPSIEQAMLIAATPQVSASHQQQQYEEVFAPLTDPLLQQVLRDYRVGPHRRRRLSTTVWIPTTACGVMRAIHRERPKACLLWADFDALPPAVRSDDGVATITTSSVHPPQRRRPPYTAAMVATGEPLVTDMHDVDHPSYLSTPETPTDILFPTDFAKLAAYGKVVWGHGDDTAVVLHKQADFLRRTGPAHVAATTSRWTGYSPLVDDFANCSVLTVTHARTHAPPPTDPR